MAAFQFKAGSNGIAELLFDLPGEKVNKLSKPVMDELEGHIDQLANDQSIKLLKFTSGKEDTFIAGADLHSFETVFEHPEKAREMIEMGHRVFNKIAALPYPTLAVIHGVCLGGGYELALACTYRVATDHPKTSIGLPEVNLGIYPAWGGSQRLPRLIGLPEGLGMILAGKVNPAVKAYKAHMVDAIVAWEFKDQKVDEFIQQILSKGGAEKIKERRTLPFMNRLLQSNPIGRSIIYSQAHKSVMEKTKGRYPSALLALDVITKGYPLPLKDGLKLEIDTFIKNVPQGFEVAKYLIGIFFTQEAVKKDTGVEDKNVKPIEIKNASVLGAGTMGATIAWLFADRYINTRMKDISWEIIGKGIGVARDLFKKGVAVKKLKPWEFDRKFQMITGTIDYTGFQHSQFVLEAATENLDLKKKIFHEVEAVVPAKAIIASNTSSLTIKEMSEGMKNPERFVGMHFFNPVPKMPLVEVVKGPKTTPEVVATTVELCKRLGKTPIVVGDCHGFLINRIFMMGANETMLMLEEGYKMDTLDKIILDWGMPMGPFHLADEVGNDVTYKVIKVFHEAYGERFTPAKIIELMYEKGFYGKKVNKGFYIYDGKDKKLNPEVPALVKSVGKEQPQTSTEDVTPRFLYGMINEATRCLEENIIKRPDYLDLALIMGIGFPPFRGGLMKYADEQGLQNIVTTLQRFEKQYGERFKPCSLLVKKAQNNETFYPKKG